MSNTGHGGEQEGDVDHVSRNNETIGAAYHGGNRSCRKKINDDRSDGNDNGHQADLLDDLLDHCKVLAEFITEKGNDSCPEDTA